MPVSSTSLDGTDADDSLIAGGGNDTLTGGDGDDFLNGGGGSDVYRFYFTVGGGETTYTFGGFDPGSDDVLQENEMQHQYEDWLASVGTDLDGEDGVEWVWEKNNEENPLVSLEGATTDGEVSPVTTYAASPNGEKEQTRYYEDSVTVGSDDQITAADGDDTIAQFQSGGPNVDKIELWGITHAQALELFDFESGDFNSDGNQDFRLTWEGATDDADGSITILGSTWTSVANFLNDARVLTQDEMP